MLTYYDSQNQPYVLTKRLGNGGEGAVYACENNSQLVAKIYREPVTAEKAGKLRWMASRQDESLNKIAAWVTDVLLDSPDGKVVGFLMPNVVAKEIHELYSLKSRRVHFPEATWHFLIHTATNVARAFNILHKNGHLMGDVNHGNCVVLPDGTVKLIDCDSYSVNTERKRFPCEVGVTTHLAPELQRVNLRNVEREEKHDNFGLAVIIFQLLFLGRHPFAGNYRGDDDKSLEDCIREKLFAYGKNAKSKGIEQPPGTLSLNALPTRLAELFERAFTTHNRPKPREWIETLEDLANSLEQCSLHPGHLFYEKCLLCPWCEIEAQTGLTLFPFIARDSRLKAKHKKQFDVVTVENLVASFNITPNLPVKLTENFNSIKASPTPEIVVEVREQRKQKLIASGIYFVCLFLGYFIFGLCAFVLGFMALCVLYKVYADSGKLTRQEETDRLSKLQYEWEWLESNWEKIAVSTEVEKNLVQIKEKLDTHRALSDKNACGESSQTHLEYESEEKSSRLEQEISNLLAALRAGSVRLNTQRQKLLAHSQKLARELAQARSNVQALESNPPIAIFLIPIFIVTPFIASMFSDSQSDQSYRSYESSIIYDSNSNVVARPVIEFPKSSVVVPDEKITQKEIAALSPEEREAIIDELIRVSNLAAKHEDTSGDASNIAEKKLKFALRFDQKNVKTLDSLAQFYYDQNKFEQSLIYAKRSQKVVDNEGIQFFIGMIYISTEKYSQAKDIFLKLTKGKMRTNESFYNLGLANKHLGNYKEAETAFREACVLNREDVDAIYQLGLALDKLGNREGVRQQYQLLKEKDMKRASDFKKAIGKSVNLDESPDVYKQASTIPLPSP